MSRSMRDKLSECFALALQIHEKVEAGEIHGDDVPDMVYGHMDGLVAKRIHNIIDGRCSLQAALDFDLVREEQRLDRDYEEMKQILSR